MAHLFLKVTGTSPEGLVGQVLASRYSIDGRLGDGGMGTVYRAHHVKMGRVFAVKILHRRLMANPKVVRRFEREAELAGRLSHPNVVGVVDVGETEDGLHYLVMEHAPGIPLASLIERDAPMEPERVFELARQLCDGLQHAHDVGLVHRDFKPENVIVDRDGQGHETARIVDFGIAILREDIETSGEQSPRFTTAGLIVGTPHYMAPEQARGEKLDQRADLFALGLIFYEMLTGRLPFEGSGVDIARANMFSKTPPMGVRMPTVQVDPILEALVHKLLEKDRELRPLSAAATRELLDMVEHHRAAAAKALGVPLPELPRAPKASDPPYTLEDRQVIGVLPTQHVPTQDELVLHTQDIVAFDASLPTRSPWNRRIAAGLAALVVGIAVFAIVVRLGRHESSAPAIASMDAQALISVEEPSIVSRDDHAPAITEPIGSDHDVLPTVPKSLPLPRKPARIPAGSGSAAPQVVAPAVEPPSAGELAKLYGSVGRELKALDAAAEQQGKPVDATIDLWPRYRWIRINEYLSTPEKRAHAAELLAKLREDIAAARK